MDLISSATDSQLIGSSLDSSKLAPALNIYAELGGAENVEDLRDLNGIHQASKPKKLLPKPLRGPTDSLPSTPGDRPPLRIDTGNGAPPVDTTTLEEVKPIVPSEIVAHFDTTVNPVSTGDGKVLLGEHSMSEDDWNAGQFNHLCHQVKRDDTHRVTGNAELIKAFNDHPYSGSSIGKVTGAVCNVFSLGTYSLARRRVVPPGYFGHYISTQRHKLVKAGVHTLMPTTSRWQADILIDDEKNPNRKYGDKVILQVPENHLAGGYRIGAESQGTTDQEFVLFSQGRHVLPESKYYGVTIVKLDSERLQLGPLTILYVREGYLGGCNHRKSGKYEILFPGPPYILHEQNYEAIELVKRSDDVFKLGPYQFVTVKAGSLAGAYRKSDGQFQLLPPGHSYQLHEKKFQPVTVVARTTKFQLGPFYYLNARPGYESGVHLKQSGVFVRLPPGKTYRLNQELFREPLQTCRDTHITECGPLTMLTIREGTLNGAYRVSDGAFVEFNDMSKEVLLHSKHWYGLVTISKYSEKAQEFGPYKVVTIREGYLGQFEREGQIEIKDPGHYKLPSNYKIFESIPVKMFQQTLSDIKFRTKDGVAMSVKMSFTWHVTDPMQVARFAGKFDDLRNLLLERAEDSLVRLCKAQNRGNLLPTKQDIGATLGQGSDASDSDLAAEMDRKNRDLLHQLARTCLDNVTEISTSSKLGISIAKLQIDRFELKDAKIMADLEAITKSELAAKAEKVRGEYEIAVAQAEMAAREKNAEADAVVALRNAKAAAEVRRTQFEAKVKEAEAENEIRRAAEATEVKIATDSMIAEANAKAQAIKAITEAEYTKAVKEREAAAAMGEKELEIKRLELQVASLREIGQAAWKYPDVYTAFLQQFGSNLRYGPMTAAETIARANVAGPADSALDQGALVGEVNC